MNAPLETPEQHHEQRLVDDLKGLLGAAQQFVEATVHDSGEKLSEARKQFETTLRGARRKLDDTESLLIAKAKVAAASTDAYVRSNPWKSAGIAAGVGLIVGWLMGRR